MSPAENNADESWEELAARVIEEADATEDTAALGYYNTVTGEEHYYNPDAYFPGASLYKLPLNMYCSEQIIRGERDWDTETLGHPYEEVQVDSLTYSNNPLSLRLVNELGGWVEFRRLIAPYMGEDPADEDFAILDNRFTARQMTRCTALLATESERFPRVIDCLLDSAPKKFLNYADVPYDIAQKYGNNAEDGNVFHVAGIVYTDDPIVLVVMTANLESQRTIMEHYCELMCGYAQRQRELRLEQEAAEAVRLTEEARRKAAEQAAAQKAAEEEAERLAREAEAARLAQEEARREAAEAQAAAIAVQRLRLGLMIGGAALVAVGCVAALFILHKRK
ncbi:MAG: hypothetical protein IJE26_07205 [Oscillospiraceae bacterium]|nr:hypothetical protein [Oscillospiraceae bacterium]